MKKTKLNNKLALYSALLLSFVLNYSCTKDDSSTASTANTGSQIFTFENKAEMKLNLEFKDSYGQSNPGVFVKVYTEDPRSLPWVINNDIKPNIKGTADANGIYSTVVTVPGHINKIFVVVDNMLYERVIEITKSSLYSQTVRPAGFGVMNSKVSYRASVSAAIAYTRVTAALPLSNKLFVLSTYNATSGLPNVVETADPAIAALVTRINNALVESHDDYNDATKASYFASSDQANIHVIDNANVWITFVSEGAGVNNAVGYFYYPTATPPSDTAHITKRFIVFPNASTNANDGSGVNGRLTNGVKVKLKYQDPNDGTWGDVFPAGTTISWFLTESGWGGSSYDYLFANRQKDQFSIKAFNKNGYPQVVLLFDAVTQKIVLGFEDTALFPLTGSAGAGTYPSDKDYNDVVFTITANPLTAINTDDLPRIYDPGDTDGDGVPDATDDYPSDPLRAYDNYYPGASTFGSLAFEDNWPSKGDYDFNDLVVDYQIKYVTNAAGNVKDVILLSRVEAVGATYLNGFAWSLTANQSNVASITTTYSGPGTLLAGTIFPTDAKGYETGVSASTVVVPFFDNAFTLFGSAVAIPGFVNTVAGSTHYPGVSISKKVTFTSAVSVASLGSFPYNPFIIVNGTRAREVHKVNSLPTSKAVGYFNTYDDKSATTKYSASVAYPYPWVLDTPVEFAYPVEDTRNLSNPPTFHVSDAFLHFDAWVQSQGSSLTDWYSNTGGGYRNGSYIFVR